MEQHPGSGKHVRTLRPAIPQMHAANAKNFREFEHSDTLLQIVTFSNIDKGNKALFIEPHLM